LQKVRNATSVAIQMQCLFSTIDGIIHLGLLASCRLINAQHLQAHCPAADDNSFIGCYLGIRR